MVMVFHRGFWHSVSVRQAIWTRAQKQIYGKVYLMALDQTDSDVVSQSLAEAFVFKSQHKDLAFDSKTEAFLSRILREKHNTPENEKKD
jgi:hypothetical protein